MSAATKRGAERRHDDRIIGDLGDLVGHKVTSCSRIVPGYRNTLRNRIESAWGITLPPSAAADWETIGDAAATIADCLALEAA